MEDKTPNDVIKIVQQNDKKGADVLRKRADEIKLANITTTETKDIITNMKKALATQSDGVALAAPQIGISKRIFIVNPEIYRNFDSNLADKSLTEIEAEFPTVFINPQIIKISKDRKKMEEGCLSVRPWYGKVKRASRATIKALDENGVEFFLEGSGLLAQIFQHETDHLEGILFIDKAKDLKELPINND